MLKLLTTILAILLAVFSFGQPRKTMKEADIIIRHANVITMTDSTPLNDCMVCIDSGRISYVGPDRAGSAIKTDGCIINATGKHLLPGMAEMHAHLPPEAELKHYFALNLVAGITTIRSMRGKDEHIAFRNITVYPKPQLYLGSPIVTHYMDLTPERADSMVGAWKKEGFDFIKLIAIKDAASFDNLMVSADKYGLKVCGHVPSKPGLRHVLNSGFNCVEHLDGYVAAYKNSREQFDSLITLTKQNDVYQCPTLDWYRVIYHQLPEGELQKRKGLEHMPDSVLTFWHKEMVGTRAKMGDSAFNVFKDNYTATQKIKLDIIREMDNAGIKMMTGADGGDTYMVPGYNIMEEMNMLQQAGMSNYRILQCATINVAKYMNLDTQWGTIEKGKQVNMILVDGNPLQDIKTVTNVETVLLGNQLYTKKELMALADQ